MKVLSDVIPSVLMIKSIDIRNFRCFERLHIPDCGRLNVIVGDNGAGKTALLEAIFLPLATSTEVVARLRQQRGLDGSFQGSPARIEAAFWGSFFYNHIMEQAISLTLDGEGIESRSLEISKSSREAVFSTMEGELNSRDSTVSFTWRDHAGQTRTAQPRFSSTEGIALPSTGEDLPMFFQFSANAPTSSIEVAAKFSEFSQQGSHQRFVDLFRTEYPWIEDLNVEVYGGAPVLFASLKNSKIKQPLPNISSGINRIVAFLLSISSGENGVVVVDEIENGIHYSHLGGVWRLILSFIREYNCQLFVSTHSHECLIALSKAVGSNFDDVRLWQVERGEGENVVRPFAGKDLKLALDYNEEIR